jgi:hypothetical protein
MSSYPPDPYPPHDVPPGAYTPQPPDYGHYATPPGGASGRVIPPAVALLMVAIVNMLMSLGSIGVGFFYSQLPPDKLEEILEKQNPQQYKQMREAGVNIDTVMKIYSYGGCGGGTIGVFVSLLTILGAVCMMRQRLYGLALMVAVLTAIPCISPVACCLIGEGIGVWALVVLLSPEVKAAFH